jgi:hypothetical protein
VPKDIPRVVDLLLIGEAREAGIEHFIFIEVRAANSP